MLKIITWDELIEIKQVGNCIFPDGTAITVGCFDGPHLGHRAIFDSVLKYAKKNKIKSGLVSFFSPTVLFTKNKYKGEVSTLRLRLKKYRQLGFDFAVLIDFSEDFAKMKGVVFFDILMKTIRMKYLAVGEDFACGYRRGLGVSQLSELAPQKDFCFDSIKTVRNKNDDLRISSTAVRKAIYSADFTLAKKLLDYPFLFDIIGPPWQKVDTNKLIASRKYITQILPKLGKYKVFVNDIFGNQMQAMFIIDEDDIQLVFNKMKDPQRFIAENLNNFDTIEFINKE